ncbi:MAG: hypothetical protein ACI3W8_02520 [Oscillospiraceae bacterium]
MTIREFRFNCLEDILNAIDDVELALNEYDDETEISANDEIHLKRYTQNVVNALDQLKSWIDDLN